MAPVIRPTGTGYLVHPYIWLSATVTGFNDSHRFWRQSPNYLVNSATVAPNSATIAQTGDCQFLDQELFRYHFDHKSDTLTSTLPSHQSIQWWNLYVCVYHVVQLEYVHDEEYVQTHIKASLLVGYTDPQQVPRHTVIIETLSTRFVCNALHTAILC